MNKISRFPELLNNYFLNKKIEKLELRDFQRDCIRKINEDKDLLLVAPPGSGKTLVGLYLIYYIICKSNIPVYLVPTTELLKEKWRVFQDFFGIEVYVHILSGEFKSDVSKLKGKKNIVILSTYEAFSSFMYRIKNFKIFDRIAPFGGVVVDEVHYLADEVRGVGLEFLVHELQKRYGLQMLLMSASISYRSARRIAQKFYLELEFDSLKKEYQYEIITYNRIKKRVILNEILRKLNSFSDIEEGDEYEPLKVLVFCYSILEAEQLYKLLSKTQIHARLSEFEDYYCGYVHAGLDLKVREEVMRKFKEAGITILFSSPVLETGVDIKDINQVVIIDADRYNGMRLLQMAGRCRTSKGIVIHIVKHEKVEKLKRKMIELDERSKTFNGYRLGPIITKINGSDVEDELVRLMYHKQLTFNELRERTVDLLIKDKLEHSCPLIPWIIQGILELCVSLKIKEALQKGVKNGYIKRVGGRYKLTGFGESIVESLVPVSWASQILRSFKEDPVLNTRKIRDLHLKLNELALRERNKISDGSKIGEILEFIKKFDVNDASFWVRNTDLKIKKGYAEDYRRQAVWLAHSLYSLYRGFWKDKIETEGIKLRRGYFYPVHIKSEKRESEDKPGRYEEDLNIYFNRMKRLIKKYAIERYYSVPLLRRKRREYSPLSRYKYRIIEIVKKSRSKGITGDQVYLKLENSRKKLLKEYKKYKLKKRKRELERERMAGQKQKMDLKNLSLKNRVLIETSLKFILNLLSVIELLIRPVSKSSTKMHLTRLARNGLLIRALKYQNKRGRPIHVYYAPEFMVENLEKIQLKNRCKDCSFFYKKVVNRGSKSEPNTYCYIDNKQHQKMEFACEHYLERVKKQKTFKYFGMVSGNIVCPLCKGVGTVGVPAMDEVAICSSCNGLIRRTNYGRFIALKRGYYISTTIYKRDGNAFIYFPRTKGAIKVYKNEILIAQPIIPERGLYILTIKRVSGTNDLEKTDVQEKITKELDKDRNNISIRKKRAVTKSYFLDEVYEIKLLGGKISNDAKKILKKQKIVIKYTIRSSLEREESESEIAQKLKISIEKIKFNDKKKKYGIELAKKHIIARMGSNAIISIEKYPNYLSNESFRWQMECLAKLIINDSIGSLKSSKLRSLEGLAESHAWKTEISRLPKKFRFYGRSISRYAPTYFAYGVKAYNPFNLALNYLYGKLAKLGLESLAGAGFDRQNPGQGILHHRSKRSTNKEILYDFIDQFRPVFRTELTKFFVELENRPPENSKNNYKEQLYYSKLDEWRRKVFYLTGTGRKKLDKLFEKILGLKFAYPSLESKPGLVSLREIVIMEAKCLANYVLNSVGVGILHYADSERMKNIENYFPFMAVRDVETYEKIIYLIQLYAHVFGRGAGLKVKELPELIPEKSDSTDPIEKYLRDLEQKRSVRAPSINVIIITDRDEDGFYSALQVFKNYYRLEGVVITVLTSSARTVIYDFSRALNYVMEKTRNYIYVLDLPLPLDKKERLRTMIDEARNEFLSGLGELVVRWIDHHELRVLKRDIESDLKIELVHQSTPGLTCKELVYRYLKGVEPNISVNVIKELSKELGH
ncbi:MAG: DEAD/DEAH box helicase, partial [Candidatus Helarchaeota archaeon]